MIRSISMLSLMRPYMRAFFVFYLTLVATSSTISAILMAVSWTLCFTSVNSIDISILRADHPVLPEYPFHPTNLLSLKELFYREVKVGSGFPKQLNFNKVNYSMLNGILDDCNWLLYGPCH
ncbi:uncharacterized protein LOC119637596 [Glossina fuscipes]|uniref:Uncharacterized protein LOC119637596 n=1 Tax=Glossina fuscipes TaxID=7396 RepID=A0A9C6DV59_9MUSC|nr:uncharacterized protein LOC119637596 [Glossina fuscipes]